MQVFRRCGKNEVAEPVHCTQSLRGQLRLTDIFSEESFRSESPGLLGLLRRKDSTIHSGSKKGQHIIS